MTGAAAVAGIDIAEMHDVTSTLAEQSVGHYTMVCNGTLADHTGTLVVRVGPTSRAGFDRQIHALTDGPAPTRRLTSDAYLTRPAKQPMVSINAWRQGEQLTVALPGGADPDQATAHLEAFAETFGPRIGWDSTAD